MTIYYLDQKGYSEHTYKVCDGIKLNDAAWLCSRLLTYDVEYFSHMFLRHKTGEVLGFFFYLKNQLS